MKTKRLFLSILCIAFGCTAFARLLNSDMIGFSNNDDEAVVLRKVVSLDGTTLKKQIKGQEKNSIKTLIVRGSHALSDDDIALLSKIPNLDTLDLSDCGRYNTGYFSQRNKKQLGIKCLIVSSKYGPSNSSRKSDIEELSDILSDYSRQEKFLKNEAQVCPNLEELKIRDVSRPCSLDVPDSLYDDLDSAPDYARIILLKEGAVVFKKGVDLSTIPANKIYSKAILTKENFSVEDNISKNNGNLIIPSSVFYMESDIFHNSKINSVVFEKSPNTIYTYQKWGSSSIRFQNIQCNRRLHAGINTFINISADNAVLEERTFMHNVRFDHVNNLTFNGDANISGNVCKSGNVLNVNGSISISEQSVGLNPDLAEFTFGRFNTATFKETVFLPNNTFGSLVEVTFKKSPSLAEHFADRLSKSGEPVIIVPEGTGEGLLGKLEPKYRVIEISANGNSIKRSYDIQMKKPGTLLSIIPLKDLHFIDSLTITGFMYDTDLKVLNDCKRLKYLDLRKAYPMYSPETQQQIDSEQEMFNAFGQLVGATANAKYAKGQMGTSDYILAKGFAALMGEEGSVKKSEKACVIPGGLLYGCESLETLLLPYRCSEIGQDAFGRCTNLKTVKLPLYLKTIRRGAFSYCENLKRVDFPATITNMGIRSVGSGYLSAFGASGIEVIDLSKCTFEKTDWKCDLIRCKNLRILKLPRNITHIEDLEVKDPQTHLYLPATIQTRYWATNLGNNIHFKSATPPQFNCSQCTLYIPKGATTAYYAKFGSGCRYIEE